MADRGLIKCAREAEDVASALHNFRDNLPRNATRITGTIGELFGVSSILREIDNAQGDSQYSPSFYRIRDDLNLIVLPSLQRTLDNVFDMFQRSRERPYQMVWDDMGYRMEREEGIGLLERLEWYRTFLRAQFDVLTGYQPRDLLGLRRQLISLLDAQDVSTLRAERRSITPSATSTPRPRDTRPPLTRVETPMRDNRPPLTRVETPISPTTTTSDGWDDYNFQRPGMPPPLAPDPPPPIPTSPTFTSSSSQTLNSSQTSYSSNEYSPGTPSLIHWAQDVFDGKNPATTFGPSHQL